MAYQGNVPAEAYTTTAKDTFNGNGSTTAFTLSLPTVTNDIRVVVENVVQEPTAAYSVSGTTLTFTAAPPSGTGNVYVVHLGPAVQTVQPPSTISNATVFESSVTVQGAFTSLGIDDNATSTAITIDSSENVLIGKAVLDFNAVGVAAQPSGVFAATRDGGTPVIVNRKTSHGELVQLQKDGASFGSIGSYNGAPYYGGAGGGVMFNGSDWNPTNGTATRTDGAATIGASGFRFKDLYLSGGVYLGGTGSANKLDDYEEGVWTATVSSGTVSGASSYTRIGRMVYVTADLILAGTRGGEAFRVGGLPFAVPRWSPGGFYCSSYSREGTDQISAAASGGSSNVGFVAFGNEAAGNEFGNGYFVFSIWYNL